jgi:aminopeptidase
MEFDLMKNQSKAALRREVLFDRLAEVAVNIGVRVQPGQELIVTASTEHLDMVRRITAAAYRAGASQVVPIFSDDAITLARFANASEGSFDYASKWMSEGVAKAIEGGAARLGIRGENPNLLAGQDPARVGRVSKAGLIAAEPATKAITGFKSNWSLIPGASRGWAKQVFPHLSEGRALAKLWDAVFKVTRVDREDPVAAWVEHNAKLHGWMNMLNEKRFAALHFRGPGTDLRVGLAYDHKWAGGASTSKSGITCNCNLPTEEVFTTPHNLRTEGWVSATKPLSNSGSLIEGIRVRFAGGKIVEAYAEKNEKLLHKLIDTDEGSGRLGEVALVPHSSPISQSGILFYSTLLDENASCHIAQGQAYKKCMVGGLSMEDSELAPKGFNTSKLHCDWMIGSAQTDVDGIKANGEAEPLLRQGEWAK